MPRLQFSLKTMLWLMAVVAVLLTAWQALKPPYRVFASSKREYVWRNGLAVTVSSDGIKIETGIDVDRWKASKLSEARGRYGRAATTQRPSPH